MVYRQFHRLTQDDAEERAVRATGQLWGKSASSVAGNAEPAVRAYTGPLPKGAKGYTFRTEAVPTRVRSFFGRDGVEWIEGNADVHDVPGRGGHVYIRAEVI